MGLFVNVYEIIVVYYIVTRKISLETRADSDRFYCLTRFSFVIGTQTTNECIKS